MHTVFGGLLKRGKVHQAEDGTATTDPEEAGERQDTEMKETTRETMKQLARAAIADPAEREEVFALFREKKETRDKLLTGVEASKVAGVTRRTLRDWELKGWVKARRITPHRVRFSLCELETFLSGKAAEA